MKLSRIDDVSRCSKHTLIRSSDVSKAVSMSGCWHTVRWDMYYIYRWQKGGSFESHSTVFHKIYHTKKLDVMFDGP